MASQQERRRENTTHERNVNVEKDLVPKRATQFEELASKVADSAVAAAASVDADRKNGGARSATVVIGVGQAGGGLEGRDDAHFESISDKVGGTGQGGARRVQQGERHMSYGTGQGQGQAQRGAGHGVWKPTQAQAKSQGQGQGQGQGGRGMERSHGEQEKTAMPSLEEMTNYRQSAQQNSIDAIRSAQQRYDKAKQEGANTAGWETKEKVGRVGQNQQERRQLSGGHEGPTSVGKFEMKGEHNKGMQDTLGKQGGQYHHQQDKPSAEQVSTHRQTTQKDSLDAQESAEARYNKAKEEAANAAWEAKEAAKHGLGAAAAKTYELGVTAKEKASAGVGATTQYISEKSRPMAETASETAQQAKEALSSAGQKSVEYTKETAKQTAEYAGEKAVQAKDTTVSTTKSVAGYVGQKAVAVGKSAAGLAGKVAEEVKDQAVVAGWGAAHLTSEVAVGATKKAGGVLGMAKDVVASAAHKATELAEVPVVMARDAAVDTGEKLADYTARKKMEAERYREEKHVQYETGEYGENQPTSGEGVVSKLQEGVEKVKENFPGGRTTQTQGSVRTGEGTGTGEMMEKGGSVLGAIGETVVEIAQSTANLPSKIQQGAGKLTDKGREMMGSMPSGGEVAGNLQKGTETLKQKTINTMAEGAETGEIMIEKGEGVLGAIGETIVEIAQHTTNLVAGAGPGVQTGVGQGQAGPRAQDEVKEKVKHKDSSNIYG